MERRTCDAGLEGMMDSAEFRRLCDDVRARFPVSAVAGKSLKLSRAGRELKACCPFHPDRTPSFTIYADDRRWHCFGPCGGGDVIDFVRKAEGASFIEALRRLAGGELPTVAPLPVGPAEKSERREEAINIWRSATPAEGTPVETYLRARGIVMHIPESLRFARLRYGKRGDLHPVMVALVASADNRATGIQRTYLNAAGTGKAAVPKPKLSLGSVRGGAIRLAPCAARLVVCEGVEDGLTLQQQMGVAVWVAAGAGMLPAMRFPPGVNSIVIGADADATGEAARKAADVLAVGARQVRIIRPTEGFKDFNDELRGVVI